jgi:serine/threonine protein kinase
MSNSEKEVRREPRLAQLAQSATVRDELGNGWIAEVAGDPVQAYQKASEAQIGEVQDALIGKVLFGTYHVMDVLGEGAMGVVYKAKHLAFDRLVAMKTLKTLDPEVVMRFKHEVRLHGKLKHQNIVEAIDCFEAPTGQTFFVMEFIEGISLESMIKSKVNVNREKDIYDILSQVCDALNYAHANGIVHRDLKPGNIMLIDRGDSPLVKVVDFGMAKIHQDMQRMTRTGQAVGSPLYMSSEQCMGYEDIDGRADQYSLAIVAYEMITGQLPFLGRTVVDTMEKHCNPSVRARPLSEVGVPVKQVEMLDTIIARALESERENRFQSIADFQKALEFWYVSSRDGQRHPIANDLIIAAPSAKGGLDSKDKRATSDETQMRKTIPNQNRAQEEFQVVRKSKIPLIAWVSLCLIVLVLCMFGMLLGVAYVLSVVKHDDPLSTPVAQPIQQSPRTSDFQAQQDPVSAPAKIAPAPASVAPPIARERRTKMPSPSPSAQYKGPRELKPKVKRTPGKAIVKPSSSSSSSKGSFEGLLRLKD